MTGRIDVDPTRNVFTVARKKMSRKELKNKKYAQHIEMYIYIHIVYIR